jgi:hypothetical protein
MNKKDLILSNILSQYNISLVEADGLRSVVDFLEDFFLKINIDEYQKIMQDIAQAESIEGHIFDQARNRPYK